MSDPARLRVHHFLPASRANGPGVRACLSAPASLAQLEDNLAALRDPFLPEERRNYLLSFGERLYEEETVFRKFVRFL